MNLLDPEINKYVKLSLYSRPNLLRSFTTSEYNFFSSESKSVEAESCLEIYNKTSSNNERSNFLGFYIDQQG